MLGFVFPIPHLLLQLTAEARYDHLVRSGFWVWIFDNVNLQKKIRHEREGKHVHANMYMHVHV